jgi:ketosteroid isomerase-like protein
VGDVGGEVVRAALDAYLRGDIDEFVSHADPEGELHSAIIGGAEGNVYIGHQGIRDWYADTFETFSEVTIDVGEWRDLGDRVLILGRLQALGRESGVKVESATGWLYTLRGRKIVKAEGFLSEAEALGAAGLRE